VSRERFIGQQVMCESTGGGYVLRPLLPVPVRHHRQHGCSCVNLWSNVECPLEDLSPSWCPAVIELHGWGEWLTAPGPGSGTRYPGPSAVSCTDQLDMARAGARIGSGTRRKWTAFTSLLACAFRRLQAVIKRGCD